MNTIQPILYLGSTSTSRQMLLRLAGIPFIVALQSADESLCDWNLPLQKAVESIACYKMEHVLLPEGDENRICFVLTADTLTENSEGKLEGKPIDRNDAITKLKNARKGVCTGTAFCLERRVYKAGEWHCQTRTLRYAQARYVFNVPDDAIAFYLDNAPFIGSGAIAIEGFGNQFLEYIDGSYSAVVGLPMYEVRVALLELGFRIG